MRMKLRTENGKMKDESEKLRFLLEVRFETSFRQLTERNEEGDIRIDFSETNSKIISTFKIQH